MLKRLKLSFNSECFLRYDVKRGRRGNPKFSNRPVTFESNQIRTSDSQVPTLRCRATHHIVDVAKWKQGGKKSKLQNREERHHWLAVWLSGKALALITIVALHQTRLLSRWATVCRRVNRLSLLPSAGR